MKEMLLKYTVKIPLQCDKVIKCSYYSIGPKFLLEVKTLSKKTLIYVNLCTIAKFNSSKNEKNISDLLCLRLIY